MVSFIASRIILDAEVSLEQGKNKYRAFFVNTTLYKKYQADVDVILRTDGYGDVIVSS